MQVALTGATGFVGRAVVAELLSAGHSVRVLARSPATSSLPAAIEVVKGDLADVEAINMLVAGAETVVHVAGLISAINRQDFFAVNEAGTRMVAEAAARGGVKRLVHVSSLSARRPELSAYGASKAAGEVVLSSAATDMGVIIIRPPAVYGPGDKATLPLVKALLSSPVVLAGQSASRFSLIHVADLARVIAAAAESKLTGAFEVDDGKPGGYSWTELVAIASEAQGMPLKPYFLPQGLCLAVASAAEFYARLSGKASMLTRDKVRELYAEDWVAKPPGLPLAAPTQFRSGFVNTVAWYRDAGWLPAPRRANIQNQAKT